jgi:MFS transporter, DHA1 family, multidrug resistance protein
MTTPANPHPPLGQREFIVLIAAMMAINALGIDAMLPALPEIGRSLHVASENTTQWVIAAYMFGFGAMQLVYGPLADRFGRKPVLIITLAGFVIASIIASVAASFPLLIAARVLQGTMSASTRVLTVSIVRDCYSGRTMARMMSLAQMIFFAIPILAPSIGSAILLVGPWRAIFWFLGGFAAVVAVWAAMRLPETLHADNRRNISAASLLSAWKTTLTNRYSLGYTLASSSIFGALMGYINSSQQIFGNVFKRPDIFPFAFAGVAAAMGVATFANSRVVERHGTRRISHWALLVLIGVTAVHLIIALTGQENLWAFLALQAMTMACFGLIGSNFGSMAMEPVGHIAGTASSVQGFVSTMGGAIIGIAIGQAFNGTIVPVSAGFLIVAVVALGIVLVTEGGRLFVARNPTT